MHLKWFRRYGSPIALATSAVFCNAALYPSVVRAQAQEPASPPAPDSDARGTPTATYDESSRASLAKHASANAPSARGNEAALVAPAPDLASLDTALAALPSGGGGVSPQAAALPSGAASQLGMGESFTMQLSTGTAAYSVPLLLPSARGRVQPRLDLSYNSGGGFGLAGVGWSFGASAISRQTDRGLPAYDDRADWHPGQDRFVFGGMELVPICTVGGSGCTPLAGDVMPAWADGWQYFRARVESGFLRFFWSPDHRTWRVQAKDGTNMELGVPLDGTGYEGALERNPDTSKEMFRWYLVRQYDSQISASSPQSPVNTIVYRYTTNGNVVYLTDIFDTSPAATPTTSNLASFAHHAAIAYESRPDAALSYRAGYPAEVRWRVSHVDVTSKSFAGGVGTARELVRRYHLSYDATSHRSLLTSVQMEGRCSAAVTEDAAQLLPSTNCPHLPPVSFEYQHVNGKGSPPADSQGYAFEPFDHTVRDLAASPPHSLDEPATGLMDVNADGLPDVLASSAGLYGGAHGLYLNGASSGGAPGFGRVSKMQVIPTAGVTDAGVLSLRSTTVAALDLDGDGITDLVHMPQAKRYAVFSPEAVGPGEFRWQGREVRTASQQDVKIDFTRDAQNVRVMDVNGDGLVDVVYGSATEVQTFFSLGRYPGGDGQFGLGTWTTASTAQLSNDPVAFCVPWSSTPVRFSDPDTQIADMNGDGLPDIVRVRDGRVRYWPGRGNGFWGTGERRGCATGSFAENRDVEMLNAPRFGSADEGTLLLNDVNGDGLSDMVEIRSQGVDIYLNDNGVGWTTRYTIDDTPFRPASSNYVHLTDVNGSGTPDILWGRANEYKYVDLTGGKVPQLLIKVRNGLGKTVELEYASSTDVMLAAVDTDQAWSTFAPITMPLLVRSRVRDNLERIGHSAGVYVTEYSYRNPVYEGRQREFRGFSEATVKTVGDSNSPTSYQRTVFQLGECSLGFVGTTSDVCTPKERWHDNWREALKGLPVISEAYDDQGVYHSTEHTTYKLRQLYLGLDGRRVTVAQPIAKDAYLYDTGAFDHQTQAATLDEVVVEIPGLNHTETRPLVLRATAGTAYLRSESTYDNFGNTTDAKRYGCISGCPNGPDEHITTHSEFALPPGESSGWLWREATSYVTGSIHTAHTHETGHTYDLAGNLETSYAVLFGTLALDRYHAVSGQDIAPEPPGRSGGTADPVQVPGEHSTYDIFGNATLVRGPAGSCSSQEFDTDYAQLVVAAHVMAGALDTSTQCGDRVFTHAVTYDRGLAAVVTSNNMTGQPSHYEYDGLGRLVGTTGPDPTHPGQLAAYQTMTASYQLPADPEATPYTVTVVRVQDGGDRNTNSYSEGRIIGDGLGRRVVALHAADPASGDLGDWIATGNVSYDAKGGVARVSDPWFYSGSTIGALNGPSQPTPFKSQEHDAFGRTVRSYGYDAGIEGLVVFHALTSDVYDAADILPTLHQGTYATSVSDGHGRGVQRIERIKVGSQLETRYVLNDYLPSGEPFRAIQRRPGSTDVVRWMKYDSLGRMVLNVEPNTSISFNPDPNSEPSTIKTWRYAYDDAGHLVGYSDARGCGANYHYDLGGRLVAEDRSPCLASQSPYTAPNLTTGDGTEAFYRYDSADPDTGALVDTAGHSLDIDVSLLSGRLVSLSGLASKTVYQYDALGRETGFAARVQKPGTASSTLANRYAPRWYIKKQTLDAAGRTKTASTGVTVPELLGADGTSELRPTYTKRGTIKQIGSSYGMLFAGGVTLADGRPQSFALGDGYDLPGHASPFDPSYLGTQRYFTYDAKHRVQDVQTYRGTAPLWSEPPTEATYLPPSPTDEPTRQLLLEDSSFSYDEVNNIIGIEDHRLEADWPGSAKPASRNFEYDDLYRLTRTTYTYSGEGTDAWKSPFDYEDHDATAMQPAPHVSLSTRPTEQRFQYDWLGNIKQSTDDQQAFWERSTGSRVHGVAADGVHQVRSASSRVLAPSSTRKGDLSAAYDAAGNLTGLIVRRDGECLPLGSSCWQRFDYEWDEVGQLAHARRWDLRTTPADERISHGDFTQSAPPRSPDAELRYDYDAGGGRTLKTAIDVAGLQKYTVYVFSGLELRGTDFGGAANDYVLTPDTVSLRLFAGPATARIVYSLQDMPSFMDEHQHVLLALTDHIGSTTFLIDKVTGELVEDVTYLTYGAPESDYRPGRWKGFRELHKFSGKEEDIELGLAYFGARYYSPYLATWISPDPVTIHDLGSDSNPYAYVHGTPLMAVDPDGREILTAIAIGMLIGVLVGGGTSVAVQAAKVGWSNIKWGMNGVSGAMIAGGVTGAVGGGAIAAAGESIGLIGGIGFAMGAGTEAVREQMHTPGKLNMTEFAVAGLVGAAGAVAGVGVGSIGGAAGEGLFNAEVGVGSAVVFGGAGQSATEEIVAAGLHGEKVDWGKVALSAGEGAAVAAFLYYGRKPLTELWNSNSARKSIPLLSRVEPDSSYPASFKTGNVGVDAAVDQQAQRVGLTEEQLKPSHDVTYLDSRGELVLTGSNPNHVSIKPYNNLRGVNVLQEMLTNVVAQELLHSVGLGRASYGERYPNADSTVSLWPSASPGEGGCDLTNNHCGLEPSTPNQ